eukprot:scpid61046/ scgid34863/ RAC family serine/threonine-protein kinase homolog
MSQLKGATIARMGNPTDIAWGFLTKQGAVRKSWKTRWMVLRSDGCLYYYKTNKANETPLGKINMKVDCMDVLQGDACKISWPDKISPTACFGIVTRERTYYLYSANQDYAAIWVAKLRSESDHVRMRLEKQQQKSGIEQDKARSPSSTYSMYEPVGEDRNQDPIYEETMEKPPLQPKPRPGDAESAPDTTSNDQGEGDFYDDIRDVANALDEQDLYEDVEAERQASAGVSAVDGTPKGQLTRVATVDSGSEDEDIYAAIEEAGDMPPLPPRQYGYDEDGDPKLESADYAGDMYDDIEELQKEILDKPSGNTHPTVGEAGVSSVPETNAPEPDLYDDVPAPSRDSTAADNDGVGEQQDLYDPTPSQNTVAEDHDEQQDILHDGDGDLPTPSRDTTAADEDQQQLYDDVVPATENRSDDEVRRLYAKVAVRTAEDGGETKRQHSSGQEAAGIVAESQTVEDNLYVNVSTAAHTDMEVAPIAPEVEEDFYDTAEAAKGVEDLCAAGDITKDQDAVSEQPKTTPHPSQPDPARSKAPPVAAKPGPQTKPKPKPNVKSKPVVTAEPSVAPSSVTKPEQSDQGEQETTKSTPAELPKPEQQASTSTVGRNADNVDTASEQQDNEEQRKISKRRSDLDLNEKQRKDARDRRLEEFRLAEEKRNQEAEERDRKRRQEILEREDRLRKKLEEEARQLELEAQELGEEEELENLEADEEAAAWEEEERKRQEKLMSFLERDKEKRERVAAEKAKKEKEESKRLRNDEEWLRKRNSSSGLV